MAVIKVEFARAGLAASATSESFLNQMQLLRDARCWVGGADGSELPRFSESTLRYLERALFSRGADLRDAVFQLAHLTGAAAALSSSGRALDLLYGFPGPVRSRALGAYMAEAASGRDGHVTCEEKSLVLRYREGQGYRIATARLPLLLALLEFLLSSPEAPEQAREVLALIERVEADPDGFETVRGASNAIAAGLNASLDRVMRSRVERDRFEALAAFLDEIAAEEDIGDGDRVWTLDDGAILAFWRRGAEDQERAEDFRQFRTVHRAFVALTLALREGEDFQRLYRPQASETEESTVQIAEEQGRFETLDEHAPSPLDALEEDPIARVKFLTGAEAKSIEIAARLWGAVRDYPLSVMRSEVFGAAQNEIINALRFRRELEPLVRLDKLSEPGAGYDAVAGRYAKMRKHTRQMMHAAAHVMAERRGIALPEPQATETRKAFRSVRRAGFSEAFGDDDIGKAFEAAIAPLTELGGLLKALLAALPEDLETRFVGDRAAFQKAFGDLYGKETTDAVSDP